MEIIFETSGNLQDLELIHKYGFCNIQITNKNKGNNLNIYKELKTAYPSLNYNLTYSVVNNYSNTIASFVDFCTSCQSLSVSLPLLVTGSRANKITSLEVLKNINFQVAVAFNPFIEDYPRLLQKIKTGNVASIYFQIGLDIEVINHYTKLIRQDFPKIKIVVSILFVSPKLLSNWNFRPWKGVFLDTNFLQSIENANTQSYQILSFCTQNNLNILCTIFGNQANWDKNLSKIKTLTS